MQDNKKKQIVPTDPTPEEILRTTREIQKAWTPKVKEERSAFTVRSWMLRFLATK